MTKQALLTAAMFAAGLGLSGAAGAQPLTFPYDAYGGFVEGSHTAQPEDEDGFSGDTAYSSQNSFGRIPADASGNLYNQFSWGDGGSNIVLNDPETSGPENGDPSPIDDADGRRVNDELEISIDDGSLFGHLTHNNQTINTGEFDNGRIGIEYFLDIFKPDSEKIPENRIATFGPLGFELEVWETQNNGNCPQGMGGSPDPTDCDDRFRYRLNGGSFGDDFVDLELGTFEDNDTTYRVSSTGFFDGDGALQEEFWSPEDNSNTGFVRIEAHEVPTPGSLALVGAGLMSLAWAGRRRSASAKS